MLSGLVAPANAVNARINFSSTTGSSTNWMTIAGEVFLDDVSLTTSAPGSTNALPAIVQSGWEVSWPSANYVAYGLERAVTLSSTNDWTDYGMVFNGTGGTISAFDPQSTNQYNFYRVYAQP
jgi:hypothetical protein